MANIKSAQKRIRVARRKTEVNKARKSRVKTYVKKLETAIDNGNFEEARELLKTVDKELKRAAHKNLIHKNKASREISRLTRKLNKAM